MFCLGCGAVGGGVICAACRTSLRVAPERHLASVGVVRSALAHETVARRLVHLLKYKGVVAAAAVLAGEMAPMVPAGAAIVPVPRLGWRRLKYGIDPATELARQLSHLTGQPLVRVLRAPFTGPVRAGREHGSAPIYTQTAPLPPGPLVLVDDVVTTGATLQAAAVNGVIGAVTATSARTQVTSA